MVTAVPAVVQATTVTVRTMVLVSSAAATVSGSICGWLGYYVGRSKNPNKKILEIEAVLANAVAEIKHVKMAVATNAEVAKAKISKAEEKVKVVQAKAKTVKAKVKDKPEAESAE